MIQLTRRLRWMMHPITIFVGLQIVWLALILIWVIWFVGEQEQISQLAKKFGHDMFDTGTTAVMLVVGCVLLAVILVGTIMLFTFGMRQSYVARQQRTFVSSVTHELKSPLASLQLAFETIAAHRLSEENQQRMFHLINTDIERLRRLVDQILITGRLDRGILAFDEEGPEIPVTELIEKTCERLSYLDPELRRRLVVTCEPGFKVHVPRSTMNLILNNLIENAVKYSPRDAPIVISATQQGKDLNLVVKDQGLGLDRQDIRRIFKMFHRGEMATKKAIPGTGLGLYIVRSLVRSIGGKIWVESAGRGQGSSFFVSLPVDGRHART